MKPMLNDVVPSRLSSASRPAHLRQANARHLLRLIQTHNPCSKADLVRYSGLSAPTVTSCVAGLQKLRLVESLGDGKSKGGRPPGMLRFNARYGYVAAADIGGTRVRMMLADLGGAPVTQWSQLLKDKQKTPAGVTSLVQEGLKEMCEESGIPLNRVLHLTAGAPGITDVAAGVVLSAPNLKGWNDVPLLAMLRAKLRIPVSIENDTNLAAMGEYLAGAARETHNFVFMALGTGLGAGIFIHGHLYHGANWSAGEVGYFGVGGRQRDPTRMRRAGQLEEAIGGAGIEARWRKLLARGKTRPTAELSGLHATEILDLAAEGNRIAREVATETALILADAIADIVLMMNPEIVVMGGGVGSHPELCRLLRATIDRHEFAAQPIVKPSALGTQAQLRGGIFMSLDATYELLLPRQPF